ncbi:MAG: ADP-ribosylglycohydrolase family protein [Promethearchaeia archaeon]
MKEISFENYTHRVLGSWYGRIIGDFVGYPLEFRPYCYIKRKYGELKYYPKEIDHDYVNDDEMYEICALIALEEYGPDLTAKEIAKVWKNRLYKQNFTAEKITLKNLREEELWPPESGTHENYYYDAIGAQMRADIWGQITPGCPEMAKKYAEMDGSISHTGIGIQGEVYIAVMISHAFFIDDIRKNIEKSLEYLPSAEESLFTQMVLKAQKIYKKYPENFRDARKELINYWHQVRKTKLKQGLSLLSNRRIKFLNRIISGVHVLPNIGIIILSLLYGSKDTEDPLGRSVCIAAMMGLDTDCNCGNIGALLGAKLGDQEIPNKWKSPLQNRFNTYVKGYEHWKITELAERVADIGEDVINQKCDQTIRIT